MTKVTSVRALNFMNIWELFREEGKLYEFVPCFEIGGICGPASLLGDRTGWTIPEYQDFAARWKLDRPMLEAGLDQMLAYMIQFSTEVYLDASGGKSDFDCAGFKQWLEFVEAFPTGIPQDAVCGQAGSTALPIWCSWSPRRGCPCGSWAFRRTGAAAPAP